MSHFVSHHVIDHVDVFGAEAQPGKVAEQQSPGDTAAGAARLPFAVMRGYRGTDLVGHTRVENITCPFTGEQLVAVPALNPAVAIVHAQEADRHGNVQLWGIPGVQKEAVLAAKRALVTVERIVEDLIARPGGVIIPGWVIDAVAEAPGGSRPSLP